MGTTDAGVDKLGTDTPNQNLVDMETESCTGWKNLCANLAFLGLSRRFGFQETRQHQFEAGWQRTHGQPKGGMRLVNDSLR
jgi:hypothetical protein